MQVSVTLRLDLVNAKRADSVAKALIPDNVSFPRGLSMDMHCEDNLLIISFKSSGKMDTLVSTIDEVLEHVSAMSKVLG